MHYFIIKFANIIIIKIKVLKLQQISFNHLLDINFKEFANLFKKRTGKLYSFLVTDSTFTSDNPSRFRKNLVERIY